MGRLEAMWLNTSHGGPMDPVDEACQGLREALSPNWRGGAHGSVLNDATIRVGDEVRWEQG